MSHLEDIRKISGDEIIFVILFISGAICPGIATLWFFEPTLLKEWGTVMVTLLAVSITLPIVSLNVLAMVLTFELSSDTVGAFFLSGKNKSAQAVTFLTIISATICMFTIGIPLLISFFMSLSIHQFSWIALSFQIVFLLVEILLFHKLALKIKKDTQRVSKAT